MVQHADEDSKEEALRHQIASVLEAARGMKVVQEPTPGEPLNPGETTPVAIATAIHATLAQFGDADRVRVDVHYLPEMDPTTVTLRFKSARAGRLIRSIDELLTVLEEGEEVIETPWPLRQLAKGAE